MVVFDPNIVRTLEMPSQAGHLNASRPTRRRFLSNAAVGLMGAASLQLSGCIATSQGPLPDLVWGRRGFSEGRFRKPRAITIDDQDQLYIVDTTGRIQVFDTDGKIQRWWQTPETENGRPTGLAIRDIHGVEKRLLVADTHYYRMLTYSLDGEIREEEQIGGTAGVKPGEFAFVTDAVCDNQGCFFIGEYNASDRIQKFAPDGSFITQFGGNGEAPGKFFRPQSLQVQGDMLWVVDSCNHRIQRFDISEENPRLIDIWGGPGTGKGQFFFPYDLAIAGDGTVVVVEYKNNRIQRLDPQGNWIASWGGPGFEPGQLNQPWGVVVDSQDRVHILDSNNHRVQRIYLPS